jgi:hypothetical protein
MVRRKSMQRKIFIAIVLATLAITGTGIVYAFQISTPQGFNRVALLMAAGQYKTPTASAQDLATWYQRQVMGWNDAQITQQRQLAIDFFNTRFGLTDTNPGGFALDPKNQYRVYSLTGFNVPSEGWIVRDGGFGVAVGDDGSGGQVLHGTFGGTAGIWEPKGSMIVFGYYNIVVTAGQSGTSPDTGTTIIVHYESQDVIHPAQGNSAIAFQCHIVAPWGDGLAQGYSQTITSPDGTIQANIRNVWTFPGLGPSAVQN